jgi:Kef-type K+ transport system membrane component KefB
VADAVFHSFFLIFTGAAVVASIALYSRQPMLVAYILLGAVLGPYGSGLVPDVVLIADISHIGIIFLLFLLGLEMQPQALFSVFKKVTLVTILSSVVFALTGYIVGLAFSFTQLESVIIGAAMMFSSTIIGIKLLPTTILHHRHIGEMMIGMLLVQDFIAIFVLLVLLGAQDSQIDYMQIATTLLALPVLVGLCVAAVRYLLLPLFSKFDRMGEYIFLLAIGWCLGIAELAESINLSREIGAFIAGITIATSPIAQHIALSLKPLRDFFLILFFFSLGAQFNLTLLPELIIPALLLSIIMLIVKPLVFRLLLRQQSEQKTLAWDLGFRLGQNSEFSLLIAYIAVSASLIGNMASHLIQATAIITFLLSSYIVVFNFPNPIAIKERLRRD